MTRELDRLIRIWRLAEKKRDLVAMIVIQSRVGRLVFTALEGAVAHG